jgi:hypothetical protein
VQAHSNPAFADQSSQSFSGFHLLLFLWFVGWLTASAYQKRDQVLKIIETQSVLGFLPSA